MSQQDGPYGPQIPKPISPVCNAGAYEPGEYVRRLPDGRVERHYLAGGLNRPGDAPAGEWNRHWEAARDAKHRELKAADLDGRQLGKALIEYVIGDPRVRACCKLLCLERPVFERLLREGRFPDLPKDELSPAMIQANYWPVTVLDVTKLCWNIARVAGCSDYEPPPPQAIADTDSFFQTARAIAHAHKAFFEVLRGPDLIAKGRSENLMVQTIPTVELIHSGRWLDVEHSDVVEAGSRRQILTGITLRSRGSPATRRKIKTPKLDKVTAALKAHGLAQDRKGKTDIEIAHLIESELGCRTEHQLDALRKLINRHYRKAQL